MVKENAGSRMYVKSWVFDLRSKEEVYLRIVVWDYNTLNSQVAISFSKDTCTLYELGSLITTFKLLNPGKTWFLR